MRIFSDRSGNFGVMTALILTPVIGVAGLAIDFSEALRVKTELQSAADAAALAAVAEKSPGVAKALLMSGDGVVPIAKTDAEKMFRGNIAQGNVDQKSELFELIETTAEIVKTSNNLTSTIHWSANVPTTLSRLVGKNYITVSGVATAVYQTETFKDFYLLLDNTPSMGVAATPQGIDTMVANTGCAFACHIVNNGVADKNSNYFKAKSLGVSIRIDMVAAATASLIDTAKSVRKTADQFRMAVYTFGEKAEDTKLLEVSTLSNNLTETKNKTDGIGLMSIPWQGYDNDQQTDFDRALTQIQKKIGTPGTGATSGSPEKIIFFVSDGVGDSYKPASCTKPVTGGRCQEPIDSRLCETIKKDGIKIAVLYTTYLPLPTDGWYNSWIKPFQTEIGTKMKQCASEGLYFEVTPQQGIAEAMNALFMKIINAPRLTG